MCLGIPNKGNNILDSEEGPCEDDLDMAGWIQRKSGKGEIDRAGTVLARCWITPNDFDAFTDPNSYTMQLSGDPMSKHEFGYVDPPHPFINYVSTGLTNSEALDTQIIETGNSLYLISGRLSLQQMRARDNAASKTRPNHNDPPGIDLLYCLEGYGPFGRFGRR